MSPFKSIRFYLILYFVFSEDPVNRCLSTNDNKYFFKLHTNPYLSKSLYEKFFSFFQDHFLVQSNSSPCSTFALSSYTQKPIFQDYFIKKKRLSSAKSSKLLHLYTAFSTLASKVSLQLLTPSRELTQPSCKSSLWGDWISKPPTWALSAVLSYVFWYSFYLPTEG